MSDVTFLDQGGQLGPHVSDQGGGWQEVVIVDFTREVDGKKS